MASVAPALMALPVQASASACDVPCVGDGRATGEGRHGILRADGVQSRLHVLRQRQCCRPVLLRVPLVRGQPVLLNTIVRQIAALVHCGLVSVLTRMDGRRAAAATAAHSAHVLHRARGLPLHPVTAAPVSR